MTHSLGTIGVALCAAVLALSGCSTGRIPRDAVPWQTAVNVCSSHYYHVWSTIPFVSDKAEASVTIVVPESWLQTGAAEGDMTTREDEAGSTADSAESLLNLVEKKAGSVEEEAEATQAEVEKEAESTLREDAAKLGEREDTAEQGELEAAGRQGEAEADTKAVSEAMTGSQSEKDAVTETLAEEKFSSATSDEGYARVEAGDKSASTDAAEAESSQTEEATFSRADSDEATAQSRAEALEADVKTSALSADSAADEFVGYGTNYSAMAEMAARETWPKLTTRKAPGFPVVLAGQQFHYNVSVLNAGDLALHSIRVVDQHPTHASFLGIYYRWYEALLPCLRKVDQIGDNEFRLRRGLTPGQERSFRLRYQAHMPRDDERVIEDVVDQKLP